MAASGDARPVQLISISENGQCHLEKGAVRILCQLRGKIAVIGIVGLFRTGKSFLLNRLLGAQSGFKMGSSVNPCTKGMWIWGRPVQLAPDYHCILLDTEGLGAAQRPGNSDLQLFSLCVLLSSFFIYNSVGVIDEQAVDELHFALHLAKHVHAACKDGSETMRLSELSEYFPSFTWVLRDFHLQLVNEHGAPITERDYLENALKPVPRQDDKNKLRDMIKGLFPDRDCVTLVRPAADERDLKYLHQLPFESLRQKFQMQVTAFVERVYATVKPKSAGGVPLCGRAFVDLAEEYCRAINASAVPTIESVWISVVQAQMWSCQKQAWQAYREEMESKAAKLIPMAEDRLHEIHTTAAAGAMLMLEAARFKSEAAKFQEYRAELLGNIGRLYEKARAGNVAASRRHCEQVAEDLYRSRIEHRVVIKSAGLNLEQLTRDWRHLKEDYVRRSVGPAQAEVLSTWLYQRMSQSIQQAFDDLQDGGDGRRSGVQWETFPGAEARQRWLAQRAQLLRQLEHAKLALEHAPPPPPPPTPADVATKMSARLWETARPFACLAMHGVPCRRMNQRTGCAVPARYVLGGGMEALVVEDLATGSGSHQIREEVRLGDVRNIWVCADSELARCVHGVLGCGNAELDAAHILLIDTLKGPVGLVVHSLQAREEFLDGMAVLIALQRLCDRPALANSAQARGAPPADARLRTPGSSLLSSHLCDATCTWLAQADDLLVPRGNWADTQRLLSHAAKTLGMELPWAKAETLIAPGAVPRICSL